MAKERIVWTRDEVNEVLNEELDAWKRDNKTLGDLFVRFYTRMSMMSLGEKFYNLTFEEINNFTYEEAKEFYDTLDAIFNGKAKVNKEFFQKG